MIMALTSEPWTIKSARTVHHHCHHGQNNQGKDTHAHIGTHTKQGINVKNLSLSPAF